MILRNRFALAIAFVAILLICPASFSQKNHPESSPQAAASQARRDDDALKNDIQKMRAILSQMQSNLAFVGSSTTPLNHQFQLEIDMWRALLDHMERHVDGTASPKQGQQGQ
jgi:small-conductance mechanosensitive channel